MSYSPPPYPYTSYSRLETYTKCSQLYFLKYVEKLEAEQEFNEHLERGKLVHAVLEEYLDPETQTQTIDTALELIIPVFLHERLPDLDGAALYEFGYLFGGLLHKASEQYQGADRIRNKDGSIPKDLISYPPSSWLKLLKETNLNQRRFQFDNQAAQANPAFINLSFSYFLGSVFALTRFFEIPEWLEKTLYVEYPVSTDQHNKVRFPGETDLYINAYLDWVFVTKDHKVVIWDHKTNAEKPSPQQVLHHPQLNLYAALYHSLTGIWADYLAIGHLRSGEPVLAAVDYEVVNTMLVYLRDLHALIQTGKFAKKHPDAFNSPCIKRDWKTHKVTARCPYLEHCWPTYSEVIALNP